MPIKTHAVLIPGLLRCLDDSFLNFLATLKETSKIFVVTEKNCQAEAKKLKDEFDADVVIVNYDAHRYILDYGFFGGPYSQILKNHIALLRVLEWERANSYHFKFLHKLRTDIHLPAAFSDFFPPFQAANNSEDLFLAGKIIFNRYDFCFSASSNAITKLLDFMPFALAYCKDLKFFQKVLINPNIDHLIASEQGSAPYARAFPVGIIQQDQNFNNWRLQASNSHANYIDAVRDFSAELKCSGDSNSQIKNLFIKENEQSILSGIAVAQTMCGWEGQFFPKWPEIIWTRFLNYSGLRTFEYPCSISLKASRISTTAFTYSLLENLEKGDLSFLNDELDWPWQIFEYAKAGGNIHKFFMAVFTTLFPNKDQLTSDQIATLGKIINSECPGDVYTPQLRSIIRSDAKRFGLG